MSPKPEAAEKTVASNRRARFDYDIQERFEAGIVLTGSEVKSLRQGRASVAEAYARHQGGELWLEQMHIPPYEQGEKRGYDPLRARKLLLHRKEIERIIQQQKEQSLSLVEENRGRPCGRPRKVLEMLQTDYFRPNVNWMFVPSLRPI